MKKKLFLAFLVLASTILISCATTYSADSVWHNDNTHHWHECSQSGCEEFFDKGEHTWSDWVEIKPATGEQVGLKTHKCIVCNKTEAEVIEKLNYLEGKYISFMGDSITTYADWSNNITYNSTIGNNAVWYTSSSLISANETWWKKSIDDLKLNLCVNNSWSGSRVTTTQGEVSSACMTRSNNLHDDNKSINPDIIVIYIGINDYNCGITLGSFESIDDIYDAETSSYVADLSVFAEAYATMIHKIINKYLNADVYCCTMYNNGNTNIPIWNETIKGIAEYFDVKIVDFYTETKITLSTLSTYTIDNLHPNKLGMIELSKCLTNNLIKYYD